MKKLSIITLVAAVLMCMIAVASFIVENMSFIDSPLILYVQRFLWISVNLLVLIVFAGMFLSKYNRKIALLGGFGAICGVLSQLLVLVQAYYIESGYSVYEINKFATFISGLSPFVQCCTLIAATLLYVEFRHDKKFKSLALVALLLWVLPTLCSFISYELIYSSEGLQVHSPVYDFVNLVSTALAYCSRIIYLFALSFAFGRAAQPTPPQQVFVAPAVPPQPPVYQ